MMQNEIDKIVELTGVKADGIRLADDGFCSRGYVIDDGRIVFKFKKRPDVTYRDEIQMLNFVNSLDLEIKLQKVGWTAPDDQYLGLYGVVGKSIEETTYDKSQVGKQLAIFLRQLHSAELTAANTLNLDAEIRAWQDRFHNVAAQSSMSEYFSKVEMRVLEKYMDEEMPQRLKALGENLVLSHGDLGDGNIFVDENDKVGVIDFNETCYLEEAADFMDVSDDELCRQMLRYYGADAKLEEKVKIRRTLRPLIVFGNYAKRGDQQKLGELVKKIKQSLL